MTEESEDETRQSAPGRSAPDRADGGTARRLVLVTGQSGAGRSTALNTLEDLNYEVIDNLPLELVEASLAGTADRPIALGIDIRSRNFAIAPFLARLDRFRADPALDVRLLYLHCDDEVLGRRYTETRRRHPLAIDRPVLDGIVAERRLIAPLREAADLLVDTTALTPNDLRQVLTGHMSLERSFGMAVFVISFSYKTGLPRAADMVFDVRFLRNPHYDPALRPLTGRDQAVADFVRDDPDFPSYYNGLCDWLTPLLPRYASEGKSYLTLAFGCTGGRHRSVFLAESLAATLRDQAWQVTLVHRDTPVGSGRAGAAEPSARQGGAKRPQEA